jgi:hypothetical protein
MGFTRQRSARSEWVRRRRVSNPEVLESRQLLSTTVPSYLSPWIPSDLFVTNPITHQRESVSASRLINQFNPNSTGLSNQGKIVSGTDRAGDKWTITVHGPGEVIVTDTTPNDGALDDDINTIQLVGTSLKSTYVTGNVIASNLLQTSGDVLFNELIDTLGVKSIELNGFELSNAVTPPVTNQYGIFLYGGVQTLSFDSIDATIDTSVDTAPYQIVIGDANTPLKVQPSIYINSINNLVFDSGTDTTTIPTTPVTSPSVEFIINGVIRNFNVVSVLQGAVPASQIFHDVNETATGFDQPTGNANQPNVPAAYQFRFPIVGTTGRTAVQATAINSVKVVGSSKNLTLSRSLTPFQTDATGLKYLKKGTFGGNADALGIDVTGSIGRLTFKKGLGDPTGVNTVDPADNATTETETTGDLPATQYGINQGSTGYPASGYLGATIKAKHIHSLKVLPANVQVQTPQNPAFVQPANQGIPLYIPSNGFALSNVIVATSGSIDNLDILGIQQQSEIKTGFDFSSYVAGLEGTRAASTISDLNQNGDMINSVISATARPSDDHYSHTTAVYGKGTIAGKVNGKTYGTGQEGTSALGNTGTGLFARHVKVKRTFAD